MNGMECAVTVYSWSVYVLCLGINVIGSLLYDARQSHYACHKIGIEIELES